MTSNTDSVKIPTDSIRIFLDFGKLTRNIAVITNKLK